MNYARNAGEVSKTEIDKPRETKMKVTVSTDSGELFSYSTDADLTGIMPEGEHLPVVLDALERATRHINTTHAGPEVPPHPAA